MNFSDEKKQRHENMNHVAYRSIVAKIAAKHAYLPADSRTRLNVHMLTRLSLS